MNIENKYYTYLNELADTRWPLQRADIMARTQENYDRFMAEIPDIGGKDNMQFEDLNFGVVFFAFYEACGRKLTVEDFEAYADKTMVEPARRTAKIMNWNNPLMPKLATRMYTAYAKKIDEHLAMGQWGNTWVFAINPNNHKQGFSVRTTGCPVYDFVKKYGYQEFMPSFCLQDHKIAEAMHGRLVRCHSVANGDGYCDWWYFGDKTPQTQEEKDYIEREGGRIL